MCIALFQELLLHVCCQNEYKIRQCLHIDNKFMIILTSVFCRTAHERAHEHAEQRLNNLKWPWERLVNVNNSMDAGDTEAYKYTDKEMYERYK